MSEIFKAYDIRGIYGTELDEGIAYLLGRAFVTHTKKKEVLIAEDMRESSQPLKEALIKGITDQGANVVDIGLASTPMFYFAAREHASGIMVTASHNPKEYNGFKLCREKSIPIGQGSGMEEIKELVLSQEFPEVFEKGSVSSKKYLEKYVQDSLKTLKVKRPLKIVVDTANGMGGHTFSEIKKQLPEEIELIPMYWELDGSFPNHEADPLKDETLEDLQKKVVELGADLGAALDGDADRIFFVDEEGNILRTPITTSLMLQHMPIKGEKVLYDVRSSDIFPETARECGAEPVPHRVGHAFIKKTMREQDILFASEVSAHIFYKESGFTENEVLSFCKVISILSQAEKPMSELVAPYQKYTQIPETNYPLTTREEAVGKMESVEKHYADTAKSVDHTDGVKIIFDDWWFSLRCSNTEPKLRLNLEVKNAADVKKRVAEVEALIK